MIVAEEQAREVDHQISDESFIPASSAALEAAANIKFKEDEKKVHPMFRRTSTNNSTSTEGMDEEEESRKPRKRRKVNGTADVKTSRVNGKVKEEPIDLLDSDEDLDRKPTTNGNGRGSESPPSESDNPQALFKVDDDAYVFGLIACRAIAH